MVVLFSLLAFDVANADIEFAGVIEPGVFVVRMDSLKLSLPDTTFLTPDWGSQTPYDTFVFAGLAAWPETLRLYGTVNGFHAELWVYQPRPDSWYIIGLGLPRPRVKFYGDHNSIEESKPTAAPLPHLTVSPSVITGQMTVRLQPIDTEGQVVQIHDALGNVVRSLHCTAGPSGTATATWNREDDRGRLVPEGVYFCRYAAADVIAVRKVLVVR